MLTRTKMKMVITQGKNLRLLAEPWPGDALGQIPHSFDQHLDNVLPGAGDFLHSGHGKDGHQDNDNVDQKGCQQAIGKPLWPVFQQRFGRQFHVGRAYAKPTAARSERARQQCQWFTLRLRVFERNDWRRFLSRLNKIHAPVERQLLAVGIQLSVAARRRRLRPCQKLENKSVTDASTPGGLGRWDLPRPPFRTRLPSVLLDQGDTTYQWGRRNA